MPYYNRDPKRDHNFDNHPYVGFYGVFRCALIQVLPGSLWEFVGLRGVGFIWLDRGFRHLTALVGFRVRGWWLRVEFHSPRGAPAFPSP